MMGAFTAAEAAYLRSQPLMRFATASPSGKPDVAPVVFELDGDDIVTSGFDIAKTVRYRNVRENPRATLVIDDLASTDPWSPRGVKVIGSCTVESHGQGERFRIHPEVVISWGVNDTTPGIPTMERREVGQRITLGCWVPRADLMSAVDLASVPDAHDVNDEYFVENFLGHCHGLASAGQVDGLTGAGSTADHIRQLLPGGCRSVMGGKFRSMSQVLVANAAGSARALVDSGSASSESLWRFGVLQLLDDYDSVLRRNGVGAAAMVFAHEPALTGHSGLDAAYAALACWLAHRDGWEAPGWARHSDRVARPWWFVSDSAYGKAWALAQSPGEFRIRGVFITDTALARA